MLTRKVGSFLRGSATPFQVYAACILGAMIGFAPPFADGPGMYLALLVLLLVVNANLLLAAVLTAIGRALALALAPLLLTADRFIIDGPLQPLFETIVNAPVLAWFGFDIYGTTAGLLVALALGVVTGFVITAALRAFRTRMSKLETDSERYKAYVSKFWVRAIAWLLVGGAPKKTYEQLNARRVGNPIRIPGVALALLLLALVWIVQAFFSPPVLTWYAQRELERLNGATVDIREVSLDLTNGKATVRGLAMADPNALDTDLLRAELVDIDLANTELLSRRFTLNRVEVSEASSGKQRARPGVRTRDIDLPEPPEDDDARTIEDYIREAEKWKERLTKLRDWIDKVSQPDPDADEPEGVPHDTNEDAKRDRIEREIRQSGYRGVRAHHLRRDSPALLIEELIARGVELEQMDGETIDIVATNVSTQPWLVERAPEVVITSDSDRINANAVLGYAAKSRGENVLSFRLIGLPAEAVANALLEREPPLLAGGTIDLSFDGAWPGSFTSDVRLALDATPRNTTLSIPGLDPTEIDSFTLPIALAGPINNPRIGISDDAVQQALIDAGKRELARRVSEELGDRLPADAKDALGGAAEGLLNDGLGGLLGGGKDDDD